ncbi:MAG: four-carbon acid sugar kinase family protein [Propionibacteriaceae bacterium]|nr:four-carbon acid sugar kinase family protein [Propionibacteriaceae bacterium]
MSTVLVIGDDLTGSNAVGALYATAGLRAVTVSALDAVALVAATADVVAFNTESRHRPSSEAARRVRAIVRAMGADSALIAKRVDTTLRGHIGAEIEAMLVEARQGRRDQTFKVLMAPAFPSSGRTTIGGIQLIEGQPVAESWAGRDPFTPVRFSRISRELARQTNLPTAEVLLDTVREAGEALAQALADASQGADIVIVDATTTADLRRIAEAAQATAVAEGITWLVADSGPFGAAMAAAMGVGTQVADPGCVLVVAGSLTDLTRRQLERLQAETGAALVTVDLDDDPVHVVDRLVALGTVPVLGVRTATPQHGGGDRESAARMLTLLQEVAREAVSRLKVVGIYATGGDVATGVIDALGAHGFQVAAEVLPLAVVGHVDGGPHHGMGLSTKGGLIGDDDAGLCCVRALQQRH